MVSPDMWYYDHQRVSSPCKPEELDLEAQRALSFARSRMARVYIPEDSAKQKKNSAGVYGSSDLARDTGRVHTSDDRRRYLRRTNKVEKAERLRGQSRLQLSFSKTRTRAVGEEQKKVKNGSGVKALWNKGVRGVGRFGDGLVEWLASKMLDKLDVGQDPEEGLLVGPLSTERKRK